MRKLHVLNFNDIIQLILGKNFLLFWVTVRIPVSFGLLNFFLNIVNLFKKKRKQGYCFVSACIYLSRKAPREGCLGVAGRKQSQIKFKNIILTGVPSVLFLNKR